MSMVPSAFERFPEDELETWKTDLRQILLDALQPPPPVVPTPPTVKPLELSDDVKAAYVAAQARVAGSSKRSNGDRIDYRHANGFAESATGRQGDDIQDLTSDAGTSSEGLEDGEEPEEEEEEEETVVVVPHSRRHESFEQLEDYASQEGSESNQHNRGRFDDSEEEEEDDDEEEEEEEEEEDDDQVVPPENARRNYVIGSARGPPGRPAVPQTAGEASADQEYEVEPFQRGTGWTNTVRPGAEEEYDEDEELDDDQEYEEEEEDGQFAGRNNERKDVELVRSDVEDEGKYNYRLREAGSPLHPLEVRDSSEEAAGWTEEGEDQAEGRVFGQQLHASSYPSNDNADQISSAPQRRTSSPESSTDLDADDERDELEGEGLDEPQTGIMINTETTLDALRYVEFERQINDRLNRDSEHSFEMQPSLDIFNLSPPDPTTNLDGSLTSDIPMPTAANLAMSNNIENFFEKPSHFQPDTAIVVDTETNVVDFYSDSDEREDQEDDSSLNDTAADAAPGASPIATRDEGGDMDAESLAEPLLSSPPTTQADPLQVAQPEMSFAEAAYHLQDASMNVEDGGRNSSEPFAVLHQQEGNVIGTTSPPFEMLSSPAQDITVGLPVSSPPAFQVETRPHPDELEEIRPSVMEDSSLDFVPFHDAGDEEEDDEEDDELEQDRPVGEVNLLGARQAGIRPDEAEAAIEDDEDSQQDKPLSSESDESDSEDDVTYDTKPDAGGEKQSQTSRSLSNQSRVASDVGETEPESKEELEQEIKTHDRRPIPHPTLMEENEEYDIDEPTPAAIPNLSTFTEGYEVVDEPGDEETGYIGGCSEDEENQLNNRDEQDENVEEGESSFNPPAILELPMEDAVVKAVEDIHTHAVSAVVESITEEEGVAVTVVYDEREEIVELDMEGNSNDSADGQRHDEDEEMEDRTASPPGSEGNRYDLSWRGNETPEDTMAASAGPPAHEAGPPTQYLAKNVTRPGKWVRGTPLRFSEGALSVDSGETTEDGDNESMGSKGDDDGSYQSDDRISDEEKDSEEIRQDPWEEAEEAQIPVEKSDSDQVETEDRPGNAQKQPSEGPGQDAREDAREDARQELLSNPRKAADEDSLHQALPPGHGPQNFTSEQRPSPAEMPEESTPADIFVEASQTVPPKSDSVHVHSSPTDHSIIALMEQDAPPPPSEVDEEVSRNASVSSAADEDDPLALEPAVLVRHHMHGDEVSHALPVPSHHQHELDAHRHAFEEAAAAIHPVLVANESFQLEVATPEPENDGLRVVEDRPSTPQRDTAPSPSPTPDPTRHYHGNYPPTAQVQAHARLLPSSPAGRTRSRCVYHKVQFVDNVSDPILLVPGCTVDATLLKSHNAEDIGEASAEEMRRGIGLGHVNEDIHRAVLPEGIESAVRHMVGIDIVREGHIYVLPAAHRAPPEEPSDEYDTDRAESLHERSRRGSSTLRSSSLTPNRKRKRMPTLKEEEEAGMGVKEDGSPSTKRQALEADTDDEGTAMVVDEPAPGARPASLFSWLSPGNWWRRGT